MRRLGFDLVRWQPKVPLPLDFEPGDAGIIRQVKSFTMTPPERVFALIRAVQYVVRNKIPGAVVECGVWRGGSMMAAALALLEESASRDLWLYDTFDGMTAPTPVDIDPKGLSSASDFAEMIPYAPLEMVRQAMQSTGYSDERVYYVRGRVEETIPRTVPESIAILRLDTDWYESTRHELAHLYPLLSPGGVLIVDDYGHWAGSRKATDEYISEHRLPLLLCRTDYSGRIAVKPH
jgi:O-methyltransferase